MSRKSTVQSQESIFRELISPKLHITYSFVIQRITFKNVLEIIFLENLISVTCNNVFGINFSIISGWSVIGKSNQDFRDLGFLSCWIVKSNANVLGFRCFCSCGLLLCTAHAQHYHYESECERKLGGFICLRITRANHAKQHAQLVSKARKP